MSCYGLQNLDGSDGLTKELVGVLTKLITISCKQEKKPELNGQSIGMSCYGLQNLDGSDESTKELVGVLTELITITCKQEKISELNGQNIAMSCYGLQNLDGSDGSTKELVGVLTELITIPCKQEKIPELNAQEIATSCYGLQNLDGSDESTKKLVDVLTGLIKNLYEKGKIPVLNSRDIVMVCYGVLHIKNLLDDSEIFSVLASMIETSGEDSVIGKESRKAFLYESVENYVIRCCADLLEIDYLSFIRVFELFFKNVPFRKQEIYNRYLCMISDREEKQRKDFVAFAASEFERKVFIQLNKGLKGLYSKVELLFNVFVHGYEIDIVAKYNNKEILIELDGCGHSCSADTRKTNFLHKLNKQLYRINLFYLDHDQVVKEIFSIIRNEFFPLANPNQGIDNMS